MYMIHPRVIIAGVVVIALIIVAALIMLASPATAPTTSNNGGTGTTDHGNAAAKADLIKATLPLPGSKVTSPLTITGQARGTWYFEASFPYELKNAQGITIAQGPVQAQGDWMTTDFVPFSVVITFPAQPAGSKGTLILHKDNPSGLPQNEDHLIIPVVF